MKVLMGRDGIDAGYKHSEHSDHTCERNKWKLPETAPISYVGGKLGGIRDGMIGSPSSTSVSSASQRRRRPGSVCPSIHVDAHRLVSSWVIMLYMSRACAAWRCCSIRQLCSPSSHIPATAW